MKSNLYTRLFAAVTLAALIAGCSAASKEDDKKARLEKLKTEQANLAKEIVKLEEEIAKENPDSTSTVRAKDVSVTEISPKKFDAFIKTQGKVESENNILVGAKSPGVVTQVYVTEGQQVSKGQTLAQIDNSVIERNIESMESQLALAKSVYERQENLWKQKIGTEVQYLQAKTNKESLEKQIASLREQNDMYKIKSAISGVVDAVYVKVGENIAPGMPAARIVNANDLKLTASVSEAYVTKIKKGNKVIVSIPEIGEEIQAQIAFVGRTIEAMSRTFSIEVNLPSRPELRPNMTATVKIVFETTPDALVVPVNVIQQINNEKVVYVAEVEGKRTVAKRKVITVNGVFDNQAQVQGLKAGDKLITFGYQGLNDGDVVKI
jgi:membrane fusion protein, multidrug efflux system